MYSNALNSFSALRDTLSRHSGDAQPACERSARLRNFCSVISVPNFQTEFPEKPTIWVKTIRCAHRYFSMRKRSMIQKHNWGIWWGGQNITVKSWTSIQIMQKSTIQNPIGYWFNVEMELSRTKVCGKPSHRHNRVTQTLKKPVSGTPWTKNHETFI